MWHKLTCVCASTLLLGSYFKYLVANAGSSWALLCSSTNGKGAESGIEWVNPPGKSDLRPIKFFKIIYISVHSMDNPKSRPRIWTFRPNKLFDIYFFNQERAMHSAKTLNCRKCEKNKILKLQFFHKWNVKRIINAT